MVQRKGKIPMNEQELLKIKEQIEEAKGEVSELQGRKKYLLQELKENWGCKTVDEAFEKIELLKKQVEDIENKIATEVGKLKNEYDF